MFRVAALKKKAPVVRTTEAEYLRGCRAELRCCIRVENAVVAVSVPGLGLACAAEKGPRMRGGRGLRGWLCRGSRPTSLPFKFAVSGAGSDWPGAIVAGGLWGDYYSCVAFRDERKAPVGSERGPSVAPLMKGCGVVETPASGGTTRWGGAWFRGGAW
jgi:hypothetical protein